MGMPLRIDSLCKCFGKITALDDLTLDIQAGELFFLLGPSGCGKTTFLRCIAGYSDPDRGRIFMGGGDVTRLPPDRRQTSMVFQNDELWPHLTVRENVAFGLDNNKALSRERAWRADEILKRVQMSPYANRKPSALSGGQRQLVALARALVLEPRCLLLDEPLSNMDAGLRLDMRLEIRHLCRRSKVTTLYVTHDQKEALSMADRLAVMRNGRFEQIGTPLELYRSPVNAFVAGFLGDTNLIPGRVAVGSGGQILGVETAVGRLLGTWGGPGAAPAVRASVIVSVRPECWRLGGRTESIGNRLAGHIEETVFLGGTVQYRIRVALSGCADKKASIVLNVLEADPERIRATGESVDLHVPYVETRVLAT